MKRFLVAALLTLVASAAFAKNDALSLVPVDAVSVGVVKLRELRTSPLSSVLFQHTDKMSGNGEADTFLAEAGLDPSKDVDILVVATSPRTRFGSEPEILVVADGRFNVDRLTKALVSRGAVKKSDANGMYYLFPESKTQKTEDGAVAFPDSSLAIIGTESAVTEALAARTAGGTGFVTASGLGQDLGRVDANASAFALIDVTRAQRLTGGARVPGAGGQKAALAAAIKSISTVALWATDTGDSLKLGAVGLAGDAETLELLEDTIRGALSAMRLAVKDKSPDMVSVLRRFSVERTSDAIRISGTIPADALRKLMAKQHASK